MKSSISRRSARWKSAATTRSRRRTCATRRCSRTTRDIVDVRFAVQYQIKSPTDYLFRNVDPDQSVMQAGAGGDPRDRRRAQPTDDLLYKDREAMRARLIDTIQRSLDRIQDRPRR